MKKRIVCLLLVLTMTVCGLASCGGASNDGGGRTDGSWEGVDFGGTEVRFAVSVNQYEECDFPAADIYTMGPDVADSNEVDQGGAFAQRTRRKDAERGDPLRRA